MKQFIFILIFIALCVNSYSQNFDLIVNANGDSVACRIDSITDSHIYFEMKFKNKWIHTHLNKSKIAIYQLNAINKKSTHFKPGTSYIKSPKQGYAVTIQDIQKNSVYVGILTINYSKMIPGDRMGFTVAGGLSFVMTAFGEEVGLLAETTLLIGSTKHFFEPGFMAYYDSHVFGPMIRTGYRYQGSEGFLFRAGLLFNYLDEFGVLPAISIGYSF